MKSSRTSFDDVAAEHDRTLVQARTERGMQHRMRELLDRRFRPWLVSALVVLLLAGAGALAFLMPSGSPGEDASLRRLAAVVGAHRLTRGRLSGDFAYAPCASDSSAGRLIHSLVCQGAPPTSWPSAGKLRDFARQMHLGGKTGSDPLDAHTTGVWKLLWGRPADAVSSLRAAVRRDPQHRDFAGLEMHIRSPFLHGDADQFVQIHAINPFRWPPATIGRPSAPLAATKLR